jgi:hypothetical protein
LHHHVNVALYGCTSQYWSAAGRRSSRRKSTSAVRRHSRKGAISGWFESTSFQGTSGFSLVRMTVFNSAGSTRAAASLL